LGELTQRGVIPRSLKIANAALDRLGYPLMTQAEYDDAVGGRSVVDVGTPSGQPEAGQPGATQDQKTPGNGGAGRPKEVQSAGVQDPRRDKMGRAFGLTSAEKKTSDVTRLPKRTASYPWLRSTPA
jgi:hypothetical protein